MKTKSKSNAAREAGRHTYVSPQHGILCEICRESLDHSNHAARETGHKKEIVGRKYEQTKYALHYCRVGGDTWYNSRRCDTLEEARQLLSKAGENPLPGFIDFGPNKDLFEYRIVKKVSQCEVLEIAEKLI